MTFIVGRKLTLDTTLYRYLSLERFLELIEARRIRLANVNRWEDPGEAILGKVPTRGDSGKIERPLYSFHERIYGSCWTRLQESDAMWRIYSPDRTGVQIAASVAKFQLITGVRRSLIDEVRYFETRTDLLANASQAPDALAVALHKRSAFQHEHEVRFLTHADFLERTVSGPTHVDLPVDPATFIEGVALDPRADNWYVDVLKMYCIRAGLRVQPSKSALYEPNPQRRISIEQRWVPILHPGVARADEG
ncbi:MAG: DUF2971 domain-containing protein [Chloroflexota bacterium]